jgi:glycogen(starch) synthase
MNSKSSPLTVAMLIDEWFPSQDRQVGSYGGTQVHVKELKNHLETDHQATVVLFYQSHQHIILKMLWPVIALLDVLLYNRYHKLSLIHVHGIWSAIPAKIAAHLLNIPIIYTVHNHPQLDDPSNPLAHWLERFVLTKIVYTQQITVSKSFTQYKNVNRDIKIIPNGVNVKHYDRVKVEKNAQPTLIWVGRDDPTKGLDVLKKAIVKIRKKIPNLQTELVADGRLQGVELIKAYKRAHVFALSSLTESQPITLLEAWAAKLPVVVTDVGDNGLMVEHGVNGYIVEAGNAQQLAHYLIKTLRARTSSIAMAVKGYEWVNNHYSWKQVSRETYKTYLQTIKLHNKLNSTTYQLESANQPASTQV